MAGDGAVEKEGEFEAVMDPVNAPESKTASCRR